MNTLKNLIKNTGVTLLTQISTPVSNFILVFFIAGSLGVSGLGKFSSSLSMLYIFQAFASLGFSYLITREVSQNREQASKYFINASFFGACFSIIVSILMCLIINFITEEKDVINSVYILSITLLAYVISVVCQSICKAFEKFEYITISQISGELFKAIGGISVLYKGYGLLELIIIIVISQFIIMILTLFFAYRCIPTPLKIFSEFDIFFGGWIIKSTPIFASILILSTIRWNVDTIILTKMLGEVEVGYYNAAFRLMNICKLGLSCYIMAIQPVIFKLYKISFETFKVICNESIRFVFILILPIAVGTALLSEHFILLIFNKNFLPSAIVLRIIIWILILAGVNLIFANALVASNKQRLNLIGNFLSMISNIFLNSLLITKFNYIGAAIANLLSSAILLLFQYYFISKSLFKIKFLSLLIKPSICALIMGVSIYLIKDWHLFYIITISIIIYFTSAIALKALTKKDYNQLKSLWVE